MAAQQKEPAPRQVEQQIKMGWQAVLVVERAVYLLRERVAQVIPLLLLHRKEIMVEMRQLPQLHTAVVVVVVLLL